MADAELWQIMANVVTVIGLPFAILIFLLEQRKERANEEDGIQQMLSASYSDFLKVVVDNADLRLLSEMAMTGYDADQKERAQALYAILISIFERAFIMCYAPSLTDRRARYWASWDDLMREWCRRADFRALLPTLLVGEDEAFARHISGLAVVEAGLIDQVPG